MPSASSSAVVVAVGVPSRAIVTTSHSGQGPPALRTASRRTRRHRFRRTAPPSFFPAINATRPEWPRPSGVCAASTMSRGWAALLAPRKIRSISREDFMVPMSPRPFPGPVGLGAQDLATLATTTGEDCAAASGSHASTEAVRLRTLPNVRLVCTLHSCSSLMRAGFGAKPDEYMRGVRVVSNMTQDLLWGSAR